jgi:hypothetical protein
MQSMVSGLLSGAELVGLLLAMPLMALHGEITEALLEKVRQWHGRVDEQFANIDNIVTLIAAHDKWVISPDMSGKLNTAHAKLQKLIAKCNTSSASSVDRQERNTLLKETVAYCLFYVRIWAYNQHAEGTLTADEVHQLAFLLPGETGGHHDRAEEVDIKAEVKVSVFNEDKIKVVINKSSGENESQVSRGWPHGVREAVIVIYADDGVTEIIRKTTTRVHNTIVMPVESRGNQFTIKAAFLRHPDDEPLFGNQPTFSMPKNTNDILATIDHHHHQDFEEQLREVEHHRREVERLQAELEAKKKELIEAQKKSQK